MDGKPVYGIFSCAMIVNRAEAVLQPAAPVGRLLYPHLPGVYRSDGKLLLPIGRFPYPQLPWLYRSDCKPLPPVDRLLYPHLPGGLSERLQTAASGRPASVSATIGGLPERRQAVAPVGWCPLPGGKYNTLRGTTRYVPLKKEPEKPAGFSGILLSQCL